MATTGLKIGKVSLAKLGGVSTQAVPIESNSVAAIAISAAGLSQPTNQQQSDSTNVEKNKIISQLLPLVAINPINASSDDPLHGRNGNISGLGQVSKGIANSINLGLPGISNINRITPKIDLKNSVLNSASRTGRTSVFKFSQNAIESVKKILPPKPDTLRLSELTITNNGFENINLGGMSSFRPEIIGMANYNPIFWPENKTEFTEFGQMISINYQNHFLRKMTLNSVFEKIKNGNNQQSIRNLSMVVENSQKAFTDTENILQLLSSNFQIIDQIKEAFKIKTIESNAYKTSEFFNLKNFFERRMQYSAKSFDVFSDTKILMQLLFDLRSSLEGYSFSLLNLTDENRKNDYNPILLDKTYTKTNNFTFSVDSIKSTGIIGRLSFDSNEFSQFLNSLPGDQTDRIKLLIHVLNKELRISKGLSKPLVRNLLKTYYLGESDGNPFDNIIGQFGNDIFENVSGEKSLASILQILNKDYMVLPFETKTVDDSQTTYIPGSRYFGDSLLNLVNGNFNIRPFNDYHVLFTEIFSKAKTAINEIYDFNDLNSALKPDTFFLDLLQSIQDGVSSLGSNSSEINNDQLILASLIRLANKDNSLKLMLFQYFLLSGIASGNKLESKKIFKRLINDIQGQIRRFSFVRIGEGEAVDLTGGIQTIRPYLEKLAIDIENKVFQLINPRPELLTDISPIVKTATPPLGDKFSSIVNQFSKIPFGITINNDSKKTSNINSNIQTRAVNSSTEIASKLVNFNLPKGNIFGKGTIKNVLLNSLNATSTAGTNILKEYVDFADKMDKISSIQGNTNSYLLENNSTRFNFVSTSYLLLFLFEIYSSFIARFFSCDFVDTSDFTKIVLIFDQGQNQNVFDFIDDITPDRREIFIEPLLSEYFKQNVGSTPTQVKNLKVSPGFLSANKTTQQKNGINPVDSIRQLSFNVFGGISQNTSQDGLKEPSATKASVSMMLETISNLSLQKSNGGNGLHGSKIGNAGAINRDFQSPTVGIESIKSSIKLGALPIKGIDSLNYANIDVKYLKKLSSLKESLLGIRKKINDEDIFVQNSLHILEVIGDRISLVNSRINTSLSKYNIDSIETLKNYKETVKPGQLRVSNWIYRTYKENSGEFGSFNSIYTDEYHTLVSCLSDEFYNKILSNSRVKLLAVGIPNGFSEKLIDRVAKVNVNSENFKDLESDVINISIYKKSNLNDDIVYHPQQFTFDLSLFPKEINNLKIDPKANFDKLLPKLSLLDFSKLGNFNGTDIDLSKILSDDKYSFMNSEQRKEMFKNHIVSYLLQTYIYLLGGLSFSEETFPVKSYKQLKPTFLPAEVETIIRDYYQLSVGTAYPADRPISQVLLDPQISDDIKDDIQLLLFGSNYTRSELINEKVLTPKKFDRIFVVPVNIDDFVVNIEETNQTTSGKRMFSKTSYQKDLTQINFGNNKILKENREFKKDALIFDDLFVTIETNGKI